MRNRRRTIRRRNVYSHASRRNNKGRKSKVKLQAIICIIMLVAILAIKKMNYSIFDDAVETFTSLVNRDYSVSEIWSSAIGKAEEISAIPGKVKERVVDSLSKEKMSPPVDLKSVLASYGDEAVFSSDSEIQVYSVAEGTVRSIKKSTVEGIDEYAVTVVHKRNLTSEYSGLTDVYVNQNDKIDQGTLLGVSKEDNSSFVQFKLFVDEKLVDPKQYIDF